jgi:hypothetical protein
MQTASEGIERLKGLHENVSGWSRTLLTFKQAWDKLISEEALKEDKWINCRDLQLSPRLEIDGKPVSKHALEQIASQVGVNTGAISIAELGYREELANVLNGELRKSNGHDGDELMLRMRKSGDGDTIIRAVLRKPGLDAVNVMEMIHEHVPGAQDAVLPAMRDDLDNIEVNLFLPDKLVDGPDSKFGRGIRFNICELTGKTSMTAYTFDHACLNGCVSAKDQIPIKVQYVGPHIDFASTGKAVGDAVASLILSGEELIALMGLTYNVPVPNPPATIAYLAKTHRLTRDQGRAWFTGYVNETVSSVARPKCMAFSVLSGLTRGAHYLEARAAEPLALLQSRLIRPVPVTKTLDIEEYWAEVNRQSARIPEEEYVSYEWLTRSGRV